ncbi:ABC transporter ATP-binding protein [Clostridium tarantellae]|uniref:ATP-binding cassette domain-containing protein n=1 Tax=Clostridium tarantellae TaxID=39493 RepID=A0A6I1MKF7_9CLOT|nr:ABC transporter ATP-binding protein [Clostridium tarantellae]MPQ42918.1 ATP-binding cassette domain-containing protein [Clostridium tarantellae]
MTKGKIPNMRHSGLSLTTHKAKDFKGTLKRLLNYLKPYSFSLILVFIFTILSTLFTILSPDILGNATNLILEGFMNKIKGLVGIDFTSLFKILIVLTILYILSSIFSLFQQYIMASIAQKTVAELRNEVNKKLNKLPLRYFDSNTKGDILSRITNDVDTIASTLQQSLTQLITAIITIIGVVIMMLRIDLIMTLVTFITLPLALIVAGPIVKKSQKFFANQQSELGKLNGHIEEMYAGHMVVKAFSHEQKSINEFNEINNKLYEVSWKAQFISGIIMPAMMFINNIGYVFIAVIGGVLVTKGRITIGNIQAFIQYSRQFTQPINQVANISNILQSTVAAAERVFEVLDEKEEMPEVSNAIKIANAEGNVKFHHVNFSYKKDTPLIKDMNFSVDSGKSVAIVGPTGAGKTTLINLLMRFYDVYSGKITIDDININNMKRGDLRKLFGMVLQDTWLFNGTIKDNIAYGNENATDKDIITAAKAAHADHFIRTLPNGYDTILNEEGTNISQGQKQLLTIARAILANPSILILDEATSSVDTRTEQNIQNAMDHLMKGRTSFVIAHRLSTIRNAHLILVMNDGTVVEKGTHDELMAKGGFYSDLYNSQFENPETCGA